MILYADTILLRRVLEMEPGSPNTCLAEENDVLSLLKPSPP